MLPITLPHPPSLRKTNDDHRQALIDATLDQMQSTRHAFEFFMEFGEFDGMEDAFNTALQLAWSVLVMDDPDLALIDPTRPTIILVDLSE